MFDDNRIRKGYQVMFGGFTVGLSISGKFGAMNADGKSYALARLKVEVVAP